MTCKRCLSRAFSARTGCLACGYGSPDREPSPELRAMAEWGFLRPETAGRMRSRLRRFTKAGR